MSLINQMLMDLEKRRAPRPEGVLSQARALPQVTRYPRWQFALLTLAVAAAIFAWIIQREEILPLLAIANTPVQTPTAPAALPKTILKGTPPAPAIANTPAQTPTAPPPQTIEEKTPPQPDTAHTPVQTPTAPAVPTQTMEKALTENPAVSESLLDPASRLSRELSTEPQEHEPVVGKPAAKAKSVAEPVVIAKAKPAAERQSPSAISKKVRQHTPQQQAQEEYRKAVVSLQQGQPQEAQEGFKRALQYHSTFAAARLALVGLLLESRQMAEAERVVREGLELDIRQPGLAMMLARVQVDKGDIQAGLETLQKTLPYAIGNADYHAFMAALLLRESRYTDAVEHYRTALNLKPSGVWYMGLGISLQAMQRLPEAQDAFQHAISSGALDPELQAFVEKRLKQISISKR
jgi:MSHA biogenesis protein MshN